MRFILFAALGLLLACGGTSDEPTATPTALPSKSTTSSPTPSPAPPTVTLTPAPTTVSSPTEQPPDFDAGGFPIGPQTPLGIVVGEVGSRRLIFDGTGPVAYDYALNDQPSADQDVANRSGWNCGTHVEYEGIAAEDFYIPEGTPVLATMDGTATLLAISHVNDFDRYGVSREPYLGNPDRSRAPLAPFPGPSSGLGVYLHVENAAFVTESGHLDLSLTVAAIPETAFVNGFRPVSDYDGLFAEVPQPRVATAIARWDVRAGDVVGMSGDSGYSEGPHLHYTVQRASGGPLLCPTTEPGFDDGGWLFR